MAAVDYDKPPEEKWYRIIIGKDYPESEALTYAAYFPASESLIVRFRNRGSYVFIGIKWWQWRLLATAASKGWTYNRVIGKYHTGWYIGPSEKLPVGL